MRKCTRVILWTSPLLVIFLEIFVVYVGAGLLIPWKLADKPSEAISRINGFHQNKLYISTDSGELFSIQWPGVSIPILAPWVKEKELPSGPEPPCQFSCVVEGGPWSASPPLLFQVKQVYQYEVFGEGGTLIYKFALSSDGNIWYWVRSFGINWLLPFLFILIIEFLGYLMALIVGFAIFLAKRSLHNQA